MTSVHAEVRTIDKPDPLMVPKRALTIGAHPDDAEFGAGGTLARWAAAGCTVSMLIVTDGSKGTWDPNLAPADLAATRRHEQEAAAKTLGFTGDLIWLDRTDGELVYDLGLREEICLWIRRLQPEIVVGHDPWRRYMLHPDHRAAGWGAIDGVVAARDHLFFPDQGLEKHRPDAVLLWSADAPDYWEDIATTFDRKIEALLCHSSQTASSMGGAATTDEARQLFVDRIRNWAADQGRDVGIEAAESFKLLRP